MTLHLQDRIEDLSGHEPLIVAPDLTLRQVATTMYQQSASALVVGVSDRPLGVITERDVVSRIALGADPDQVTAEAAMSRHFAWTRLGDPLFGAVSQMIENDVRHLPVLDSDGLVVGMISVLDLLRPLLLDAWGG